MDLKRQGSLSLLLSLLELKFEDAFFLLNEVCSTGPYLQIEVILLRKVLLRKKLNKHV